MFVSVVIFGCWCCVVFDGFGVCIFGGFVWFSVCFGDLGIFYVFWWFFGVFWVFGGLVCDLLVFLFGRLGNTVEYASFGFWCFEVFGFWVVVVILL